MRRAHAPREEARASRARFLSELTARRRRAHEGGLPRARRAPGVGRARRRASRRSASARRSSRRSPCSRRSRRRLRSRADASPGADVFRLYDTYGLPLDFTEELAKDRGLGVDRAGFERELAGAAGARAPVEQAGRRQGRPRLPEARSSEGARTDFLGYDAPRRSRTRACSRCCKDGQLAARLDAGQEGLIVLDRTPFYAMSGGQVGDHGVIASRGLGGRGHRHARARCPASTSTT